MLLKLMTVGTIGEASLIRDGLLFEGIEVELRGEHRASIAGELPLGESEVELWVRAADGTRALALIAATRSVDASESVRCEKCLETARKKTGEKVSEVCDLNRDGMFEIDAGMRPQGGCRLRLSISTIQAVPNDS